MTTPVPRITAAPGVARHLLLEDPDIPTGAVRDVAPRKDADMLTRFAQTVVRRRRAVLIGALLAVIAAFAYGGNVASKLSSGGFTDPASPSSRADAILDSQFHAGNANLVLLVTARTGTVDSPAAAAEGNALTAQLAADAGVDGVASYWSLGSVAPLRSGDGRQALIFARLTGSDDQVNTRVHQLTPGLVGMHGPVEVAATGQAAVFRQLGDTVTKDLGKAEGIAIPVTLVLLVFVFGSVIAASLPLAVGVIAIGGTFAALTAIQGVTNVSIFSLNLTTALGLGLAIDYSLFIVNRYRDELRAGLPPDRAVVRTVETAGRTVLFSSATVAISLGALLVFPLYFLRSFAYAGIAVVVIAAAGALVVLPALLAALGQRVNALDARRAILLRLGRQPHTPEIGEGFWHRLATAVMRRPVPIATAVIVVLLVLGSPFLGVHFADPDARVLPPTASTRAAADAIAANFRSGETNAFAVVAPKGNGASDIASYAARVSTVAGVARVDALTGSYAAGRRVAAPTPALSARFANPTGTWLSVVPVDTLQPQSPAGEHLVDHIRALPAPWPVLVDGASAQLIDANAAIFAKVPLALGIIAVVTFITLFLMFGSVLVPLKALVLNVLSLTATFGAMVWVFQEGHGAGLLQFTATGTLNTTMPILMFCIAFGLSMDYEVFLLSRIKEEHDHGATTTAAVARGLERTGRIVTSAAALLAVVFLSFATSSVSFIKLFGVGLTLAVLMDATLIRGLLVPAFMRLAGNANWWAPKPLRAIYDRIGISESDEPLHVPTLEPVPVA
jgi:putative drug exporter of the RND superfamily